MAKLVWSMSMSMSIEVYADRSWKAKDVTYSYVCGCWIGYLAQNILLLNVRIITNSTISRTIHNSHDLLSRFPFIRPSDTSSGSSWKRVVGWRQKFVNVHSFIVADVAEPNPILSQPVMRDHHQLTFDIFIYSMLASKATPVGLDLTIAKHARCDMASTLDHSSAAESLLACRSDEA